MFSRFVGREDAQMRLDTVLDQVEQQGVGLAVVRGEAGVGKSALVSHYVDRTTWSPSRGRFGTGSAPDWDLERVVEAFGVGPSLVDELLDLNDAATDLLDNSGDVRRLRVVRALALQVLRALEGTKRLVVFEDLHWASEPALQLIETVLFASADEPSGRQLAAVITTRPLEPGSPADEFVDRITRPRWADLLDLRPLGFDEVAQILRDEEIEAQPVGVVQPVMDVTKGNPLHVLAIVSSLREGKRAVAGSLPTALSTAVQAWADRLSPEARSALGAVALMAEEFDNDELARIAEIDAELADRVVAEGRSIGLLTDVGNRVEFGHDLLRRVLQSVPSPSRLPSLHLRCAEVIRSRTRSNAASVMAEAKHLLKAGELAPSDHRRRIFAEAGEAAFSAALWPLAATLFTEALDLEPDDVHPTDGQRSHLLLRAGRAHHFAYATDRAADYYEHVLNLPDASEDDRFAATYWMTRNRIVRGDHSLFEQPDLDPLGRFTAADAQPTHRALALALASEAATHAGRSELGRRNAVAALDVAESLGDPKILGRATWSAGMADLQALEPGLGMEALTQASTLARQSGDELMQTWTDNRLGLVSWMHGDVDASRSFARSAAEGAETLQVFGELAHAASVEAGSAAASGDFRRAVREGGRALRLAEHSGMTQVQYFAFPTLIWVHLLLGEPDEATDLIEQWKELGGRGLSRYRHLVEARRSSTVDRSGRGPTRAPRARNLLSVGFSLADAELAVAGGDEAEIRLLIEQVRPLADSDLVVIPTWPALPRRVLGQLQAALGEHAEALGELDDAVELARAASLLPELTMSLLARSECLAAQGHQDDARRAAAEALELAERLQMPLVADDARAWTDRLVRTSVGARHDSSYRVVLVTDVVDSTALSVTVGDREYIDSMEHHIGLAEVAVAEHGGHVFDIAGDGLLAWFYDAAAAEASALQILGQTHLEVSSGRPPIRVGLAGGNPIQRDDRVYGATVNLGARVCSAAAPNSLFATPDLAAQSDRDWVDEGTFELKGFPQPVPLHSLRRF